MAMVDMQNVVKDFGKVRALDRVSIQVNKGEIYGFIGPNGAGKTTTIRVLLGILKASDGAASIFGKDVWKDAVEIHKRIAFVPGDVNLWPNLTGGEVIDLFVRLRRGKQRRYREELIQRYDLDPSKKCRTYSKGNRQKVALVAAFAADAELYILDEPTSGLDPLMEQVFQESVMEVKKEGKSVLLSSHILSEVEKLCDKVSIIRQGKIIDTGTLDQLRHLSRTNVKVRTEKPLRGLKGSPHIHDLRREANRVAFSVDAGDLGRVIAYLSKFNILNLDCTPPSLEELFISHYENQEGSNDG